MTWDGGRVPGFTFGPASGFVEVHSSRSKLAVKPPTRDALDCTGKGRYVRAAPLYADHSGQAPRFPRPRGLAFSSSPQTSNSVVHGARARRLPPEAPGARESCRCKTPASSELKADGAAARLARPSGRSRRDPGTQRVTGSGVASGFKRRGWGYRPPGSPADRLDPPPTGSRAITAFSCPSSPPKPESGHASPPLARALSPSDREACSCFSLCASHLEPSRQPFAGLSPRRRIPAKPSSPTDQRLVWADLEAELPQPLFCGSLLRPRQEMRFADRAAAWLFRRCCVGLRGTTKRAVSSIQTARRRRRLLGRRV